MEDACVLARRALRGAAEPLGDEPEALVAFLRDRPVQPKVRLDHVGVSAPCLGDQPLERTVGVVVIGLQDGQVLAARRVHALVHGSTIARVGLVDHAEARVGIEVALNDRARAIR